ncbi:glutamate synthase [NADPH [Halorhodospira halochloris]|uniref:Glutamate synthase [NADPH n=1 Tax=Halorhodospira halochloris TaxID=1052 RepID=A0A0X8X9G9_HALHR|nr:L,D-transpeptidase [Halorhodospira halochloris]MBK1652047.1 L,D-transpeptidase [Halorhodospira halochloris]MCG5549404.1 L,D-transpeptidase [Halorhodospira halochloris]BAU57966.1 glutamate synthase [NADPH [Halorhodospira halochloris]
MAQWINIELRSQQLTLWRDSEAVFTRPVSTAAAGAGELNGSGGTPRGWHYIRAKIGANAPRAAVFRGRRATGEIWTPQLARQYPQRDWILSRILWLCGLEPGFNRLGDVDTMRRFIYIHGCPDDEPLGVANSHGCVRMDNDSVMELFDLVDPGIKVWIGEGQPLNEED